MIISWMTMPWTFILIIERTSARASLLEYSLYDD